MALVATKPKVTAVGVGLITNLPFIHRIPFGTNYLVWKEFTVVDIPSF